MMPVEWPIAGPPADLAVDPAPRAGRDRLSVVRRDLFLDEQARLTEQERALVSAMLRGLVDQIADELRIGLPLDLLAEAEADRERLPLRLWRGGSLDRAALIELLVRRADEQMIATSCRPGEGGVSRMIENLVGNEDGRIASAAMALAVARGRRRDRFGRVGIEYDDLPAEEAVELVSLVAAAMRRALKDTSVAVDEALATAAERLLQRHDEGRRVEMRAAALGAALVDGRGPDDGLVVDLCGEGDSALLAAILAVRGGVTGEAAWNMLVGGPKEAMLLARLAGLAREAAAGIVAAFGAPLSWGDPGSAIGWFDSPSAADVDSARRWWRLPSHYRDALGALGGGHGRPSD